MEEREEGEGRGREQGAINTTKPPRIPFLKSLLLKTNPILWRAGEGGEGGGRGGGEGEEKERGVEGRRRGGVANEGADIHLLQNYHTHM